MFPQPALPTLGFSALYDAWNRLAQVSEGSDLVAAYAYDGRNRRIESRTYTAGILDETRHLYYSDAWQVLEERVDSTTAPADAQYAWGIRYVDELICRDRPWGSEALALGGGAPGLAAPAGAGGFAGPLEDDTSSQSSFSSESSHSSQSSDSSGSSETSQSSSSRDERERIYALQDANFNVTGLLDAFGDVLQRFVYEPYGTDSVRTPSWSPTTDAYDWRYRFAGYRAEGTTMVLHVRSREYSVVLGRFLSRDHAEYLYDRNLYAYVGSKPLVFTDSLGLGHVEGGVVGAITFCMDFCTGHWRVTGWVWAGAGWRTDWGDVFVGAGKYIEGNIWEGQTNRLFECGECHTQCCGEGLPGVDGLEGVGPEAFSKDSKGTKRVRRLISHFLSAAALSLQRSSACSMLN